jgi:carbonic anhydrase/acetyltransferase-like protein (isoleucine patch superfamily)
MFVQYKQTNEMLQGFGGSSKDRHINGQFSTLVLSQGGNVDLKVTGGAIIKKELIVGSLIVRKDTQFLGNLIIGGNEIINGNLLITQNEIIGGNLIVGKNEVIGGNLTVGQNEVVDLSLYVGDDVHVGGNVELSKSVFVGQNVLVDGNVVAAGQAIFGGNGIFGGNVITNSIIIARKDTTWYSNTNFPSHGSGGGVYAITLGNNVSLLSNNLGSAVTYTNDSVNGDTWTINQAGYYSIVVNYAINTAGTRTDSLDTLNNPTANYATNIPANLMWQSQFVGNDETSLHWTGYLSVGTVVQWKLSDTSAAFSNTATFQMCLVLQAQ